ncbi:MAG: DUF4351 domain-containing protein [Acidobacteriota bacterium]
MVPQTYEQFIAEAHQTGIQEGRQIGVQEGHRRMRALLQRQIEHRFGPLSDDHRARLDAIDDPDALDQLAEQLLDAPSADALLTDDANS